MCFEERGKMCVSELWSGREKASIGYQKREQILVVNKLPVVQEDILYEYLSSQQNGERK
jgi:hypothetical protein